jgi:Tfp pilus assembly protein PilX
MARPLRPSAAGQRGAAIFVVMMAILLLSGMGMWSMHSAALVDRAAGYERASLQAQYVSELGLLSASSYLSLPSMASVNYRLGERAHTPGSGDRCESIPTSMPTGVTSFCKSLWQSDIQASTITTLTADTTTESSFGPVARELQGDFTVEMTSPRRAIVPGAPMDENSPYRLVTLTSYGTVRPHTLSPVAGNLCAVSGTSSAAQNSAAGRIAVRSHAIIGPIE